VPDIFDRERLRIARVGVLVYTGKTLASCIKEMDIPPYLAHFGSDSRAYLDGYQGWYKEKAFVVGGYDAELERCCPRNELWTAATTPSLVWAWKVTR